MSIIHDALKKVEKEGVYQEPQSPKTAQPAPPSPVTGKKRGGFSLHIPSLSLRKNLLGVDIGSSSIKLVHLACSGGACRLKDVGYVKLPYGAGESGAAKALKTLLSVHGIGRSRVSSSIRNKSLTFSHIKLPKMPKDDLTEAVRWEVKKGIDFPEDAIIDYVVIDELMEEGKTKLSIMTFAVRKEEVMGHVGMLKEASLIPDVIDVGPMALLSAFDYNYGWEKDKRYAVLDIGASKATLSIISNGSLRFARYIPLAGDDITRIIQDAEGTDFQAAEDKKLRYAGVNDAPEVVRTAVKSFKEGISIEVRRSFTYYQAHLREGWVDSLLLSGGSANIKGLAENIGSAVGVKTAIYDSMKRVEVKRALPRGADITPLSPIFVEAFGLALRREGE
ncbi:MAG: type IV pilus assembly protein PilM [Deltaproteobacteria bacterium]